MKNKPLDIDNDLDKTIGEGLERISVLDFSIKGDDEMVFVSSCKLDKKVKSASWGSGKNIRMIIIEQRLRCSR